MRKQLSTFKIILRRLGQKKYLLLLSALFSLITVVLSLYIPVLTGRAVDLAAGAGSVNISGVCSAVLAIGVCALMYSAFDWVMNVVNNRLAYDVSKEIRIAAFKKIKRLELKTLDKIPAGDIISRTVSDVEQLSDGVLLGITQVLTGVVTILGTLVFMVAAQPLLALAVVAVTPLSLAVSSFVAKRTYSMFKLQAEKRASITTTVNETVAGMKTVKAFTMEENMVGRFEKQNEELRQAGLRAIFFSSITNPSTRFVNSVVYAIVAVTGALCCIKRPDVMTIGGLSCLLSYASRYTKPFNEISGVVAEFQNALACARRVFDFIDMPELDKETEQLTTDEVKAAAKGDLCLNNVSFSYGADKQVLKNISLTVKRGMHVAIVGPTGCGKTTLINLLMRFYEPDSGNIMLNGIPYSRFTREQLRTLFGMVLQDTWLKAGTVKEILRFGSNNITDEQIKAACEACHAHGFISRLKNGYDTYIGENGSGLSEGQKQLMCIARVMLRNPEILILDEATSSIDTRTEMRVQDAFDALMKGKTAFIVAHRLSTIRTADLIVAVNDGEIVETGTHAQLIKRGGFYADLYSSQFK